MTSRLEKINEFHYNLMRGGADGAELMGWSSRGSQYARFKALATLSEFSGGTVLDYGCGDGELNLYLRSLPYDFEYMGVDQSPIMIEFAKSRFDLEFSTVGLDSAPERRFDYIFLSGIFQFKDTQCPDYVKELLIALSKKCRRVLCFNLLSAQRDDKYKTDDEQYFTPSEVAALASEIGDFWRIDHSYHPGKGDATVAVFFGMQSKAWSRQL